MTAPDLPAPAPDAPPPGPRPAALPDRDWWRDAVVYQIYPRSFADADGDGVGDLKGIASRVGYLSQLGVDAVWLSPFYPSAWADGGYDVDDHRAVDPQLGTLDDFDAMTAALHGAGIRVIIDIVPNHSSNRHRWFQEALAAPKGSPARDRYIFRDGVGQGGAEPPTDWTAAFGRSAWQPVGDGQFYLHLFSPEQPDWNWANPEVREDHLTTLRFWADRGVDGFRVDVAMALAKGLDGPLPSAAELAQLPSGPDHPLYDRAELFDIYAGWRAVFNQYDPPRAAVGEAWLTDRDRLARYATEASLGQVFDFDLMWADFDAGRYRHWIEVALAAAQRHGSSLTWVLSNHDVVRHRSRFGLPLVGPDPGHRKAERQAADWLKSGGAEPAEDRALGLKRARAAIACLLALPGSVFVYQGEELGLPEVVDLPAAAREDPIFFHSDDIGRDGCRVPLPWTPDGPSYGFGPGSAHLPQPGWFAGYAVGAEAGDPGSTLSFYRRAVALRRGLLAASPGRADPAGLEWLTAPPDVLSFRRPGGWGCAVNFGAEPVDLPGGRPLLASGPLADGRLPGATAVWLAA
ncbi:MAG: glycoside hydrolase family 13 protein [Propionibacteriaceae bacterium]|jgi:alpha-glucosidase|nr:glycoside hydrolase family 13 protein [Propionibacteriaceae bacterium]